MSLNTRTKETSETRGLEVRQGGDGRLSSKGVESVWVRAHLYERLFQAKPFRRTDARCEPRGQLGSVQTVHSTVSLTRRGSAGRSRHTSGA